MRLRAVAILGCLVVLAAAARADELDDLVARARTGTLAARLAAIHELGKRASPRALEVLIGALADEKGPIRAEAAWAVSRLDAKAVVAPVGTVARTGSPAARLAAFEALAQLPGDAGIDVLEDCVLEKEPAWAAIGELVREHASRARRAAFDEALRYGERRLPESIPEDVRAKLIALRRACRFDQRDEAVRAAARKPVAALPESAAEHVLAAARADPARAALFFIEARVPVRLLVIARRPAEPPELRKGALDALDNVDLDAQHGALEDAIVASDLDAEAARRSVARLGVLFFAKAAPGLARIAASAQPEDVRAAAVRFFASNGRGAEVRAAAAGLLASKDRDIRALGAHTLEGLALEVPELAALIAALEAERDEGPRRLMRRTLAANLGVSPDRDDLVEHARRRLIEGEERRK